MSEFSSYLPPVGGPQIPFDPSLEPKSQAKELAQALHNFAGQGPPQSILEQLEADPQLASEPSTISHFLSVVDHIKQAMADMQLTKGSVKIKGIIEDLHALFRTPVGGEQGISLREVMDNPTSGNAQAYLEGACSPQSKDWVQQIMTLKMQAMSAQLHQHVTY